MTDIEREEPVERNDDDEVLPSDAPAAGVLDDSLDDPPEPSEPG
jgi:hypothetical protein